MACMSRPSPAKSAAVDDSIALLLAHADKLIRVLEASPSGEGDAGRELLANECGAYIEESYRQLPNVATSHHRVTVLT